MGDTLNFVVLKYQESEIFLMEVYTVEEGVWWSACLPHLRPWIPCLALLYLVVVGQTCNLIIS